MCPACALQCKDQEINDAFIENMDGSAIDTTLPFIDTLIKEYLLFRGFTETLTVFSKELAADKACGFQAERITELIFARLIPNLQCQELMEFLDFMSARFYTYLDSRYEAVIRKMEQSIIKCLLVTAIKANRRDKVEEFFRQFGDELLEATEAGHAGHAGGNAAHHHEWRAWAALAFVQQPARDPAFQAYFSAEWRALLEVSFRNFISEVLAAMPLPAVLRFNTDRHVRLQLARQVEALQAEVDTLRRLNQVLEAPLKLDLAGQGFSCTSGHSSEPTGATPATQQCEGIASQPLAPSATCSDSLLGARQTDHASDALHERDTSPGPLASPTIGSITCPDTTAAVITISKSSSNSDIVATASTISGLSKPPRQPGAPAPSPTPFRTLPPIPNMTTAPLATTTSTSTTIPTSSASLWTAGGNAAPAAVPRANHHRTVSLDAWHLDISPSSSPPTAHPPTDFLLMSDDESCRSLPAGTTHMQGGLVLPSSGARRRTNSDSGGPAASDMAVLRPSLELQLGAGRMQPAQQLATAVPPSSGVLPDLLSMTSDITGLAAGLPLRQGSQEIPKPMSLDPPRHTIPAGQLHASALLCCHFSPSGEHVASASADGMVCIWRLPSQEGHTPQPTSAPTPPGDSVRGREARLQCGGPVTTMAWDARADKVMLLGVNGRGFRAWHMDTHRFVAELPTEPGYTQVLQVACSPLEPLFVTATATAAFRPPVSAPAALHTPLSLGAISATSAAGGSGSAGGAVLGDGRLSLWNMRSFKKVQAYHVPGNAAVTSLCFNHPTSSWLAAGTVAGTVHLYDVSAGKGMPVRSWHVPAAAAAGPGSSSDSSGGSSGSSIRAPVEVAMLPNISGGPMLVTLCDRYLQLWSLRKTSQALATQVLPFAAATAAPVQDSAGNGLAGRATLAVCRLAQRIAVMVEQQQQQQLLLVCQVGRNGRPTGGLVGLWGETEVARGAGCGCWHPAGGHFVAGGADGSVTILTWSKDQLW